MEELARFLSHLLESGDDTLELSLLDGELRENIQTSIHQSLLLSASLIQSQSILEVMFHGNSRFVM